MRAALLTSLCACAWPLLIFNVCKPEIVPKQVISDRQAYMKLLARLHEMYVELDSENISAPTFHLADPGKQELISFSIFSVRCYEWCPSTSFCCKSCTGELTAHYMTNKVREH